MSLDLLRRRVDALELSQRRPVELEPVTLGEFIEGEFKFAIAQVEGVEMLPAPHLTGWAQTIEANRFTALIAARGFLKSTICKGVVGHALRGHEVGALDALYYSATADLARWHLRRLKDYLAPLAMRWGWSDDTRGEALLRYSRPGAAFVCELASMDGKSTRGRRADLVVVDDPIDPSRPISLADSDRALETFRRRILPLLKDDTARVLVALTPIVQGDLADELKKNPEFHTVWMPAIDNDGLPTWPEKFPLDQLERLRRAMGERAFGSEFLLKSVGLNDSYLDPVLVARAMGMMED